MPFISKVAIDKLPKLTIFGNDYDTIDGTGVRYYIHLVDLANQHLSALNYLKVQTVIFKINLGSGTSVLQLIQASEKVSVEKITMYLP